MTRNIRLRTVAMVLAATAACLLPRAAWTQATRPADVIVPIGTSIEQLAATLHDPRSTPDSRLESARRLVLRQTPAARKALGDALQNFNSSAIQLAAAKALASDPAPDPALVNALFACIGPTRALSEAAANALANYRNHPDVLTRLIVRARDRELNETVRIYLIRAIGQFIEKPAAQFLVSTLVSPNESKTVHEAAAAALRDLTGIVEHGQDPQRWSEWWSELANRPDADFRNEVLPRRSVQYNQLHQRYSELIAGLREILRQHYRTADAAQRPDILMAHLTSPLPEIRAVGAMIIRDAAGEVTPIPAAARDQLRNMIADSNPQVRAAVADALAANNDIAALDPLLEQLAQETDPVVRATIARALGPINDLKAVDALLTMLRDPSPSVAQATAEALELLGSRIRNDNQPLARLTAEELLAALRRHPAPAGNIELREALIDAMVPLKQDLLLPFLVERLRADAGEPPTIRRLAVKAIGAIGHPQSAGILVNSINEEKDASVRLEAVAALGTLPNASEYSRFLLTRLDPSVEPDLATRDRVWRVLESVFPDLDDQRLNEFVDKFPNEPNRKLAVLKALAAVQLKNRKLDDLAITNQNIGSTLMGKKASDPREAVEAAREAAEYFRQALEHQRSRPNAAQQVIIRLMDQRMDALLRSEQYPEAIAFARQSIAEDNTAQPTVAVPIVREAQRLLADAKLEPALRLIAEAMKMDPPLAEQYRDQLREIESEVRKKESEQGGAAGFTSPRAATRPADPASTTASGQ